MDAVIRPYGTLDFLTQREISELSGPEEGYFKKLFHRCAWMSSTLEKKPTAVSESWSASKISK